MTSFVIDDLPRRLDLTPKIGIANATLSQQIDLAAEKLFDGGGKIEVTVSIRPGVLSAKLTMKSTSLFPGSKSPRTAEPNTSSRRTPKRLHCSASLL